MVQRRNPYFIDFSVCWIDHNCEYIASLNESNTSSRYLVFGRLQKNESVYSYQFLCSQIINFIADHSPSYSLKYTIKMKMYDLKANLSTIDLGDSLF